MHWFRLSMFYMFKPIRKPCIPLSFRIYLFILAKNQISGYDVALSLWVGISAVSITCTYRNGYDAHRSNIQLSHTLLKRIFTYTQSD